MTGEHTRILTLDIEIENAAFGEEPGREAGRILKALAERLRTRGIPEPHEPITLTDANGNTVGEAVLIRRRRWEPEPEGG